MSSMNLRTSLLAVAAVAGIASSAQALVWTDANIADANTIALYRFDENTGATAASSAGTHPSINLTTSTGWSSDVGWLSSGIGTSLNNAVGTAYIGTTASTATVDWSLPGVTISFWMKDVANLDQDNNFVYLGHDGWRNVQAFVGYHAQWSDQYLRTAGVEAGKRTGNGWLATATDGQWHHIGLVYDNAADTGSLYFDNVKQVEWSTVGGLSAPVTEFMSIGRVGGSI